MCGYQVLRKEYRFLGNSDELARLLGENMHTEETLLKLMGDSRTKYEQKLRERLASKQKRIEEGWALDHLSHER